MYDNRLSKAILSIVLAGGVIIFFATSSSKKAPPDEQKSPPLSATNSVIHPISVDAALHPLSKLDCRARHAMMKWLRAKIYSNHPINKMRERLT